VVVPDSVPPPGLAPIATVMLAVELVTGVVERVLHRHLHRGADRHAGRDGEGWTVNPSLEAAAGLMVNPDELAPVRAPEAAVSV